MIVQEANYATELPGRMILKLCKHFRHKVPAEFSEEAGRVDFQPGLCLFTAEEGLLSMRLEGESEKDMGRMRYIIEDHLQRFARVEKLDLEWRTSEA